MKNLKKFLAVVLAVAIMATSMATAFAADAADPLAEKYPEAALMRDLGILQGSTGVTEAYLGQKPVRIQAAILTLRLMGKEADARAYAGLANFADKIADGYWAKSVMGYLKANPAYGWRGDGQGKMNPEVRITKKEFAKVLVIALKYPEPLWDEVMGAYKAAGLTYLDSADDAIDMNDIAIALEEALRTPVKGSSNTLAWTLSTANEDFKAKAIAKGLIQAVAIKSVASVNLGSVAEGTEIVPPATVVATMTDGSTKDVAVVWEKVDTSKAGDVTVKGTVEGFEAGTTATVKVVAASITGVEAVEVTAYVGEDAVLPETVKATYSNGLVADVAVVWEDVDTSEVAELEVKGTIEGYEAGVVAKVSVVEDAIAEVAAVEDVTVAKGEVAELPETVEATYASGKVEEVAVVWEEVDTSVVGEVTVKGTVEGYEEGITAKVIVEAVALVVDEVVTDNLKSFTVKFNKEVASATVTAGTTAEPTTTILADKKTVVGYFTNPANLGQSTSIDFVINAKTADGEELKDYKVTKVFNDTTIGSLTGAIALNPKQVELQFSEPVNFSYALSTLLNDVKLDGTVAIAKAIPNYVKNTVVLEFNSALAAGTHTIEVAKVRDFANFVIPTATYSVAVAADTVAPKALSAEVKTKNEVVVTFDESLSTKGTFEIDDVAIADGNVAFVANTNNTKVSITGLNLGIGAIVEVKVEYKGQKDVLGNEVKDFTVITTKTTDDTELPTASLSVAAGNKVTITFTKPMLAAGNVEVYDKDSKKIATVAIAAFKADSDSKVLELTGAALGLADVNPGNYSIKLVGMKDASIRGNALSEAAMPFAALDTLEPSVSANYLVTSGTTQDLDTVTIYFSEAMDVATIENLANYMVGNTPLTAVAAATGAKAAADGKSVVITYDNARSLTVEIFKVVAAKDLAGNTFAGGAISGNIAKLGNDTLTYTAGNVRVTGVNTVEVTFNAPVASVDPSLFVVYEGASAKTNFVSAAIDGTKVKFTTAVALDPDADKYTLKVNVPSAIKNIYGKGLTTGGVAYAVGADLDTTIDVIKPTLTAVEKGAVANTIKLTFSEAISEAVAGDIAKALLVKNADGNVLVPAAYGTTNGKSVVIAGNVVTITFNNTGAALLTAISSTDAADVAIKISFPVANGIQDVVVAPAVANSLSPVGDLDVKVDVDIP